MDGNERVSKDILDDVVALSSSRMYWCKRGCGKSVVSFTRNSRGGFRFVCIRCGEFHHTDEVKQR